MGFLSNSWRPKNHCPTPPAPSLLQRNKAAGLLVLQGGLNRGTPPSSSSYMRILFDRGSSGGSGGSGGTTTALLRGLSRAVAERRRPCRKDEESVVVIMGATGTGKSKLSIDVASLFPSEVVNCDKIQVYRGLDITTNKMPPRERLGVPHHLLGDLDPAAGELYAGEFRSLGASAISGILSRRRLPVLAGGSNSFLHALLADKYDYRFDPFAEDGSRRRRRLRYRCCFIWVDVEEGVLGEHLDRRVDDMVGLGMVEELEGYFAADGKDAIERHPGLGKAIGVPEFREYFKGMGTAEGAVAAIKENTRRLAEAQVRKIKRLGEMGWALRRVDATGVVRARMSGAGKAAEGEVWVRDVAGPSIGVIRRFLEEGQEEVSHQFLPLAVTTG